jgi:NAD(P)-dependent dehydrogenase (short-subunit alcohol dehydrogenase family)
VGRLEGKVALVTGAASGIGHATAKAFWEEGARVALADLRATQLEERAAELRKEGAAGLAITGDVAFLESAQTIVEQTIAAFAGLDILVNVAGIDLQARIEDTSEQDWDRVMNVNVKSVFLLSKYAIPHLLRRGGGAIVNIASAAALSPIAGRPAYNASKAAVVGLTKSLALDLAPRKVRVNCICPGAVDTPLLHQALNAEPDPLTALIAVTARYPLGRLATAAEVARAAVFLASDEASFITGATLTVDGGRTMH